MVVLRAFPDELSVPVDLKPVKRNLFPNPVIQRLCCDQDLAVADSAEHRASFILMDIEILSVKYNEVQLVLI